MFLVILINYEVVLDVVFCIGYIEEEDIVMLNEWCKDLVYWEIGK